MTAEASPSRPVKIWDVPTRLFHWILVILLAVSWLSGEQERFDIHFWSGYAILALILFRILWGIVGSDTARFTRFLRSPLAGLRHLGGFFHPAGRQHDDVGHNPAGGWMVVILLAAVTVQAGTGLFTTDDLFVDGPLANLVSSGLRADLSSLHRQSVDILLILAGVHVVTVLLYLVVRRQNLIGPMITGRKTLPKGLPAPRLTPTLLAVPVVLAAAALVAAIVWGLPALL